MEEIKDAKNGLMAGWADESSHFSYTELWEKAQKSKEEQEDLYKEKLKMQVWRLKHVPVYAKEELVKLIEFGNMRKDVFDECKKYRENIEKEWPEELKKFVLEKLN